MVSHQKIYFKQYLNPMFFFLSKEWGRLVYYSKEQAFWWLKCLPDNKNPAVTLNILGCNLSENKKALSTVLHDSSEKFGLGRVKQHPRTLVRDGGCSSANRATRWSQQDVKSNTDYWDTFTASPTPQCVPPISTVCSSRENALQALRFHGPNRVPAVAYIRGSEKVDPPSSISR